VFSNVRTARIAECDAFRVLEKVFQESRGSVHVFFDKSNNPNIIILKDEKQNKYWTVKRCASGIGKNALGI